MCVDYWARAYQPQEHEPTQHLRSKTERARGNTANSHTLTWPNLSRPSASNHAPRGSCGNNSSATALLCAPASAPQHYATATIVDTTQAVGLPTMCEARSDALCAHARCVVASPTNRRQHLSVLLCTQRHCDSCASPAGGGSPDMVPARAPHCKCMPPGDLDTHAGVAVESDHQRCTRAACVRTYVQETSKRAVVQMPRPAAATCGLGCHPTNRHIQGGLGMVMRKRRHHAADTHASMEGGWRMREVRKRPHQSTDVHEEHPTSRHARRARLV
jgi:hypothetical protein